MFECVINVSEGRDASLLEQFAVACGETLLDVHRDPDYHRSVFTLAGSEDEVFASAQSLSQFVVEHLDISAHSGMHPRLGVVDVVPFVPFVPFEPFQKGMANQDSETTHLGPACTLRDRFAQWISNDLGIPSFLYGPAIDSSHPTGTPPAAGGRTLPEIRKGAFRTLPPDFGPDAPHPSAGACAVGARSLLVAYNIAVSDSTPDQVRQVAENVRGPAVRALGFSRPSGWSHVSCNLVSPFDVGPADVFDRVVDALRTFEDTHSTVHHGELVGLMPKAVLDAIDPDRWVQLGISPTRTIEARLAKAP